MARRDTRGWGATPQIPQNGKEKDRDESNRPVINVIFGGEALGEHAFVGAVDDRPTTKRPRRKPIWLSDKDLPASVNVMYHDVFLKLGRSEDQLTPIRTQLAGFTGDTVETEGSITLPVELGTPPHVREMHMEFVVVKVTCAYNLILGRLGLVGLGGLISMEHLRLKFHTVAGVGIVRGDQHLAQKCYSTACEKLMVGPLPVHTVELERERSTGPEPAVELEEIPLHPIFDTNGTSRQAALDVETENKRRRSATISPGERRAAAGTSAAAMASHSLFLARRHQGQKQVVVLQQLAVESNGGSSSARQSRSVSAARTCPSASPARRTKNGIPSSDGATQRSASTGIHFPVQLEQLASDGEPRSTVAIVSLRQRRRTLRWRRPNSSSAFIHYAFDDQGARWRLTEAPLSFGVL
nr:uncharacterized protein LOC109190936 [Ipomoea batatas]